MKFIPQKLTRHIGRAILKTKKNSPHIFFVGGVAGVVGTTVLACRATLKLEDTLDEIRIDLEKVKAVGEIAKNTNVKYTEKQYTRDLGFVYGKSARKLVRLYGPSVALGVASISALTGSHVQMTRRNSALTATLVAVSKAYDDYRQRVQAELGEKKELDIYRNVQEVEDEKTKKKIKVVDPNGLSPYARFFDEYNPNWQKDAEHNRIFVQCQQNYVNHLLNARGHVFLNEVYDQLGMERSKAGQVVGWVMGGDGDNFIDFGIFDVHNSQFVNGNERSILLDFNVDGVVYDKIKEWR